MASVHYKNSTWIKTALIYEKVNGQWIKKLFAETVLEDDIIYVPVTALGLLIDESTNRLILGEDRILI